MRNIIRQSWTIYRQNFWTIVALVVVVWLPLELLSSYMDAFVFGEDDFRRSWKFSQFLDNFFGIIATAAVISVAAEAQAGNKGSFGESLSIGFASWGRMFWSRFLSGAAFIIGLILLIVPGIYLLARLSLVEQVAVQERISGSLAMKRSFALTKGRYWLVFRLGAVLSILYVLLIAAIIIPTSLIPALDNWLIQAALQLIADVVAAFGIVAFTVAYGQFKSEPPLIDAIQ